MSSSYSVDPPHLDLVFPNRPFDLHWSISRHYHFYVDLDMNIRPRNDLSLGMILEGWQNLEGFILFLRGSLSFTVPFGTTANRTGERRTPVGRNK